MTESRFDTDRRLGYRDEAVSVMGGRAIDAMGAAAEEWVAEWLAVPYQGNAGGRDRGYDLVYRGRTIDVKWTKYEPPSPWAGLRVPTWKAHPASLFVCVMGETVERFTLAWTRWATAAQVEAAEVQPGLPRPSGAPAPYWFIPYDGLTPFHVLARMENA